MNCPMLVLSYANIFTATLSWSIVKIPGIDGYLIKQNVFREGLKTTILIFIQFYAIIIWSK